jgi:hypothetical protein
VKKLEQALRGKGDSRLKDLEMMGSFQHTGPNELLNSLRIKVGYFFHLSSLVILLSLLSLLSLSSLFTFSFPSLGFSHVILPPPPQPNNTGSGSVADPGPGSGAFLTPGFGIRDG